MANNNGESKKTAPELSNGKKLGIFLIAFICFIALAVAVMVGYSYLSNAMASKNGNSKDNNGNSYTDNDALTVLSVTGDYIEDASSFLLLHMNPKEKKITVTVVPSATKTTYNGKEDTLKGFCNYGGPQLAADAAAAALNIKIDKYIFIHSRDIEKTITLFDPIEFEVPEDINFSTHETSVTLGKGKQILDGAAIFKLMKNPGWSGGAAQADQIFAEFTCSLVNNNFSAEFFDEMQSRLTDLVMNIKTNISYMDYMNDIGMVRHLAQENDGAICRSVSLDGRYSSDEKEFILDMKEDSDIYKCFPKA